MIYRLFRKELSVRSALDLNKPEKSQSLFIEEISRIIKVMKRRQKFYGELQGQYALPPSVSAEDLYNYNRQYQTLGQQTRQIMQTLNCFQQETFFTCKAYVYTAFMRISEMVEKCRGKYRSEGKRDVEKGYEDLKRRFTEVYNRQIYEEKYDITQMFELVIKDQNLRINRYFPKKRILSPLNTSKKILEQLKQNTESCGDLRKKTISVEILKTNELKLEQIINKKLIVPELATFKRVEERKKEKAKPKIVNLFKLYEVLEVKAPIIENNYTFRIEMESNMIERNQVIRESIRKWEKRCLASKKPKKEKK